MSVELRLIPGLPSLTAFALGIGQSRTRVGHDRQHPPLATNAAAARRY